MSDETTNAGAQSAPGATPQPGGASDPRPQYRLIAQYVKDLSFESPRPPVQLPHTISGPQVAVAVNVNAHALNAEATMFETELSIEAKASKDDEVVFIAELLYAGVLELINVPDNLRQPLTMVEGPRVIFPFARRVIADVVRDGGFPPLMIEPIDFGVLYQRHLAEQQSQNKPAATDPPA